MSSKRRTATKGFQGAPLGGVDFRVPLFAMPEDLSPFLFNFFNENGKLRKRDGHNVVIEQTSIAGPGPIVVAIDGGAGEVAISISDTETKNLAGTTSVTPTNVDIPSHDWTYFKNTVVFAGRTELHLLNPSTLAWTTGASYSSSTAGLANAQRRPICSYRERLYIGVGKVLEYSNSVGSTSTLHATGFDMTNLINGVGILAVEEFSFAQGIELDQYLVVVSDAGEVLIFSGSYPGDASWGLVHKFKLSFPYGATFSTDVHPIELIKTPNDLIINYTLDWQMFSLREILTRGAAAAFSSILEPIRELWDKGVFAGPERVLGYKTTAYWAYRNSLVTLVSFTQCDDHEILADWESTFSEAFVVSNNFFNFIIVQDLDDGSFTLHTAPRSTVDGRCQIRSNGISVFAGGQRNSTLRGGVVRLFDPIGGTPYQDPLFDSPLDYNTYNAVVLFSPPVAASYHNKKLNNLILHSNLSATHSLSVMINNKLSSKPGSFKNFATAETSFEAKRHVLGGTGSGDTFIIGFKEASAATTPFEIYGISPIFEDGGEF